MHKKGPTELAWHGGSTFDLSPLVPGGVWEGKAGISPRSLSWGGTFNHDLPGDQPCPLPGPGTGCVCRGDLGSRGPCLSFPGSFAGFKHLGRLCPAPQEQMGHSGNKQQLPTLRGLGASLPTLCAAPHGPCHPDHKGCLCGHLWGYRGHS